MEAQTKRRRASEKGYGSPVAQNTVGHTRGVKANRRKTLTQKNAPLR
jgi:hypothetical protein